MPALWSRIYIRPDCERPANLSYYPRNTISKRVLPFVRRVDLAAYAGWLEGEQEAEVKENFERHLGYMSGCLRVLRELKSTLHSMSLYFTFYDPNNYPADWRGTINEINDVALHILERVSKMKFRHFEFNLDEDSPRVEEIFSIIGPKVDKLRFRPLPVSGEVASPLRHFERLKSISLGPSERRDPPGEEPLWNSLSQLPTLQRAQITNIPLSLQDDFQLPQLIHLRLSLWWSIGPEEWARSLVAVFKQMSGLESLVVERKPNTQTRSETETMQISTVACVNLRELTLDCPQPKGLVSTIAKRCAQLTRCFLNDKYNIGDEDIRQLSQSCPNLRELRLRYAECITTGLEYLAALHQLEVLELSYTMGKYLLKPVLLNFAKECPKLEKVVVSDWQTYTARSLGIRPFEETPLEGLFPAAVELPSYFEPNISINVPYHPDGLDEYEVRIDKL